MDSRPAEIRHGVLHVRRHAPATTPGGPARRLASPHAVTRGEPAGAGAEVVHRAAGSAHPPLLHVAPTPVRRRAASDASAAARRPSADERTAREPAATPFPLQRLQPVRRPPQALRMLLMRQPDADIAMTGDGAFTAVGSAAVAPGTRSSAPGETVPLSHETTETHAPQHRTLGESLRSLADSVFHPGRSTSAEEPGESPSVQRATASTSARPSAPGSATPVTSPTAPAPTTVGASPVGVRPAPAPLLPSSSGKPSAARPDELLRGAARANTRPLPAWAAPLARRITGGAERLLLSEGHETRQALQALGARGATLDSTVFVSEPVSEPTPQAAEILAHEFVHVPERPTAPRYFTGILDAGERLARRTGRRAMSAVRQAPQQPGGVREAVSDAAGATSGALASARGSAEEQIEAARGMASGYAGRGISALRGGLRQATGAVREAAGPTLSRLGSLPIPGASALAGSAEAGLGELGGMASGALGQATQSGQEALESVIGGVQQGVEAAGGALWGAQDALGGALSGAQSAAGAAGDAAMGSIGSLLGGGASSALDATSQMGELMELIEDRIVAEIERRGGRFQGAF